MPVVSTRSLPSTCDTPARPANVPARTIAVT